MKKSISRILFSFSQVLRYQQNDTNRLSVTLMAKMYGVKCRIHLKIWKKSKNTLKFYLKSGGKSLKYSRLPDFDKHFTDCSFKMSQYSGMLKSRKVSFQHNQPKLDTLPSKAE